MGQGQPGYYGAPTGKGIVPAKKSSENGCLIWGLAGCGLVMLIGVVGLVAMFSRQDGFGGMMKNSISAQSCGIGLESVSSALESYKVDHKGNYPAKLTDLVPNYLSETATQTCGGTVKELGDKLVYHAPTAKSPGDAVVVEVFMGKSTLMMTTTLNYVRILKNGQVVTDQVTRSPIRARYSSRQGENSEDE